MWHCYEVVSGASILEQFYEYKYMSTVTDPVLVWMHPLWEPLLSMPSATEQQLVQPSIFCYGGPVSHIGLESFWPIPPYRTASTQWYCWGNDYKPVFCGKHFQTFACAGEVLFETWTLFKSNDSLQFTTMQAPLTGKAFICVYCTCLKFNLF